MKIHMKLSENHKKGNKYLSSFWFSQYRLDFLSVLIAVSGYGNSSVSHSLISKWVRIGVRPMMPETCGQALLF